MGRAINASELMLEIQACNWESGEAVKIATLTPPNEPLTRKGDENSER